MDKDNMQPVWLFDADSEGTNVEAFQAVLRKRGWDFRAVKFFPENRFPGDIVGAETLPLDARALFFGRPAFMAHIQQQRRWRPGGWCTFANFSCHVYYAYFGEFLLNADYVLLPAAEAARRGDELFANAGCEERLFVRPSVGRKIFAGGAVEQHEYDQLLQKLDPQALVVTAKPKPIGREWRLYICGDRVITHCQYAQAGQRHVEPNSPPEVVEFAQAILRQTSWRPDPIFTIDVCESEGELFLLELNGFSCSDLYAADLEAIVDTVSAFSP